MKRPSGGLDAGYDSAQAASYWSSARHEKGDELAAVLSLGEPRSVNEAYDAWEVGLLLDSMRGRIFRRGLDLGTGVGRVAVRVASCVTRLACADLAPGMLSRARSNTRAAGVTNVDVIRLRSDGLPFRDGSFGVLFCLGLMEHLPRGSRRATLREAARVLAKGGILALVLNNASSRFLANHGDNPLRDGIQRPGGYYCALVDARDLLEEASPEFEDRLIGSNLLYSLQRHAARRLPESERRAPQLSPFFHRAAAWDAAIRPIGPLPDAAADHHLHLLVRR